MQNFEHFRGRNIFLTGHTGFKGSWLCHFLSAIGAKVTGFSLEAESKSHFLLAETQGLVTHIIGDIMDLESVTDALARSEADLVIHMAAQPLVKPSYQNPLETFQTNIIGTANVLEATKRSKSFKTIAVVTSDKCYENSRGTRVFCEDDHLGGHDPYSASKAACEIIVSSFAKSFFIPNGKGCLTLRGGNVIGGGDWGGERLVPEIVEALLWRRTPIIRNPKHERPWQFVLDALSGYLAAIEYSEKQDIRTMESFNIGPLTGNTCNVQNLVELFQQAWDDKAEYDNTLKNKVPEGSLFYEADTLALDISKALRSLNWRPRYDLVESVRTTVAWYKHNFCGDDMKDVTSSQIIEYLRMVKA